MEVNTMNIKKGSLIMGITVILLVISPLNIISQKPDENKDIKDLNKVNPLSFEWPYDKHSGFLNYAQELLFNKDLGLKYLETAKEYYNKGYDKIAIYQANPDSSDAYIRNRYKMDATSPYGLGIFRDFRIAEYWLFKSLEIVKDNLKWDPQVNTNPEYDTLVENTFKNLIYIAVYNAKFHKALEYLNIYKDFNPDEKFINEWGSRIAGNIIILHKKYSYGFTGKQSFPYLKQKHRESLLELIKKHYPESTELQKELGERIYPEYIIFSSEPKPIETGKEETKN